MSDTIGKNYDPKPIEDSWYAWWLEQGLFRGDVESDDSPFSIVIPPPNVTGSLHMGHALNNTLQDITCRYMRMRGKNVLWLPGTDHAGIATQNVVEKQLGKRNLRREDLGRESFVEEVWAWKEEYGSRIINQLKKLGASCDWERERFTMDEGLSKAVREVFVKLYKDGLIYRGEYIINWCPRCHTALSDLEVEHLEQQGHLYYVRYPFTDGDGSLVVATTRPETILGDVAIAVHPRDAENSRFIGKTVVVPLVGREIPVIEDSMVDPEFGTGLVKITPAHDPNDFLVGQRHGLESVQVIDENGRMCQSSGPAFEGLDRFEARKKMVELLKTEELLEKIEEHQHAVGHCYRCDTMIEPYLSEQWFVKTGPLAKEGIQAVRDKRIKIIPEQWETTYFQWMENIRDWCISRQLWWGHRIPAWTCSSCGHITVSETDPQVCEKCNSPDIIQDEDVLDTWFSSALWPFSTMGWPDKTRELEIFYPTGLLTTGFDILFFWVARMIMMGLRFMGEVPFRDVYIHALVRDENGQKMSKSRGNVIDPLDIIEQYGADSLRMALAALTVQGRDIFLSTQRIETYRLFMNKIWNASRFALMHIGGDNREPVDLSGARLRIHDKWMLKRLADVTREVTERLDGYFYGEAARTLYEFFWNELCDWYLEMVKPALYGEEGEERKQASRQVVSIVFRDTLKLLHPFIPFVTEELWRAFGFGQQDVSIERSSWPEAASPAGAADAAGDMASLQEIVRGFRNLRAEAGIHPQKKAPRAFIGVNDGKRMDSLVLQQDMISLLSGVEEILFLEEAAPRPAQTLTAVFGEGEIFLEIDGILNVTEELERLAAEKLKIEKNVVASRGKLKNDKFISRAPAEVVEKERTRLSEMEERIQMISRNMESLKRE